jgi:hypothetical protein
MMNLIGSGVQKLQDIHKKVEDSFEQAIQGDLSSSSQTRTRNGDQENRPGQVEHPDPTTKPESEDLDSQSAGADINAGKLSKQVVDLKTENERLLEECTRIAKRLAAVEEKHRERFKELEGKIKSNKDLGDKLQQSENRIGRMGESLKHAETQLRIEQEKCSKLQSELSAMKKGPSTGTKQESMAAELSAIQEERDALILAVRNCEAEIEKVRMQYTERLESLASENAQLTRYCRELEERAEDRLDEYWLGSFGSNEIEAASPRVSVPEMENVTENPLFQAIENELRELKHKACDQERINSDLQTRKQEQIILQGRLEARLAAAESMRKSLADGLEAEIARRDEVSRELANMKTVNEKLARELKDRVSSKPAAKSGSQMDMSSGENSDLQRKFELALQAIGKLSDDLEASRQREEELRRRMHS